MTAAIVSPAVGSPSENNAGNAFVVLARKDNSQGFIISEENKYWRCRLSQVFLEELRSRIARKQNAIVLITGQTGIGKSYAALYLAEQLDPTFSVQKVAFSMKEFSYILHKLDPKPGESLVLDEASIVMDNRNYRTKENIFGTHIFTVFRHRLNYIFLTAPASSHIDKKVQDLAHYKVQIIHRDDARKEVIGMVRVVDHNTIKNKTYNKSLKYGRILKYPAHSFYLPSDKLVRDYEALARPHKTDVEKEVFEFFHEQKDELASLTDLQREVVQGARLGMSVKEMSETLGKKRQNISRIAVAMRKRGIIKRSSIIQDKYNINGGKEKMNNIIEVEGVDVK